jgi:ornithine cyclodeaminase/alanine dehydrogenase-like protein (mu-crystallin family)
MDEAHNHQPPKARPVLMLSRRVIAELMQPEDWLAAVEEGFRAAASGRAASPAPLHLPAGTGGFHVKAASILSAGAVAAFKINGNFPGNPAAHGLPTIQGLLVLCDAERGSPLAVMDSGLLTSERTAAATALAARFLARPESSVVTICGCGEQGSAQLRALAGVLPLGGGFACDVDAAAAARFAERLAPVVPLQPIPPGELHAATRRSDVIVTCTTSKAPLLDAGAVSPGAFVAAVGADSPAKNEIAPGLMAAATVVVDVLEQALAMGDLHHAVAAGVMRPADVHADLAELVCGARRGRCDPAEITLFDSTGTALEDVAGALALYRRAIAAGVGEALPLLT